MRNVLLFILGVVLLCSLGRACGSSSNTSPTAVTSPVADSIASAKAARAAMSPDERKAEYMERVARETASVRTYQPGARDTEVHLTIDMALFSAYGMIIREARDHTLTQEEAAKVARLRTAVVAMQRREFPKVRRAWVQIKKQAMWEQDVEVSVSGAGNRTINFTAGIFAANANKQRVQDSISENLCLFRFSRSTYRWYRGADQYTYYDMDGCPKDSDVGVVENGGWAITE